MAAATTDQERRCATCKLNNSPSCTVCRDRDLWRPRAAPRPSRATGYVSVLDPPPGDPRVAHPPRLHLSVVSERLGQTQRRAAARRQAAACDHHFGEQDCSELGVVVACEECGACLGLGDELCRGCRHLNQGEAP